LYHPLLNLLKLLYFALLYFLVLGQLHGVMIVRHRHTGVVLVLAIGLKLSLIVAHRILIRCVFLFDHRVRLHERVDRLCDVLRLMLEVVPDRLIAHQHTILVIVDVVSVLSPSHRVESPLLLLYVLHVLLVSLLVGLVLFAA